MMTRKRWKSLESLRLNVGLAVYLIYMEGQKVYVSTVLLTLVVILAIIAICIVGWLAVRSSRGLLRRKYEPGVKDGMIVGP